MKISDVASREELAPFNLRSNGRAAWAVAFATRSSAAG